MKTITVIMMMLVAVSAGAQEWIDTEGTGRVQEWQWSIPIDNMTTPSITPIESIMFENAGTLTWEGGIFKFSGDPDESAVVFLDWVQQYYNERAKLYCTSNNAEIKALLERVVYTVWAAKTKCNIEYKETAGVVCAEADKNYNDLRAMIERLK